MADLTLFHTAKVHIATFDAIRDRIAPQANLTHVVREDWLARARRGGVDDALGSEITAEVGAATGPTLCSCTSLGAVADDLGMIRIDRPMMEAANTHATTHGGAITLAYCLTSTAEASIALLRDCAPAHTIVPLFLGHAWPKFEAGDHDGFSRAIAADINTHIAAHPTARTVVLAQASMMGAATHITSDVAALSSPEMALRAGLGL